MSEVLSQSEIDELLSALSSGDIVPEQTIESKEKHQVKKYDFRSPKKFSKDHISTLEMIYDSYSRVISGFLTAQVRSNVQVKVAIIDQVTYEEFIRSISSPTILTIFKMPPLNGSLLLETSPQFVFQFLDILFGGSGDTVYKTREFTEIEKNVIRGLNEKLIDNLKLAWEDVLTVEPEVEEIETNPALNQTMAPTESVVVITLSVKINNIQSYINYCIPYISVEKLMDKFIIKYRFKSPLNDNVQDVKNQINKKLQNVPLNITAKLGKTKISVKNFLELQSGDVIMLNENVTTPLDVYVENRLHFKVLPGTHNRKRAVQIAEIIDKDVEDYE